MCAPLSCPYIHIRNATLSISFFTTSPSQSSFASPDHTFRNILVTYSPTYFPSLMCVVLHHKDFKKGEQYVKKNVASTHLWVGRVVFAVGRARHERRRGRRPGATRTTLASTQYPHRGLIACTINPPTVRGTQQCGWYNTPLSVALVRSNYSCQTLLHNMRPFNNVT